MDVDVHGAPRVAERVALAGARGPADRQWDLVRDLRPFRPRVGGTAARGRGARGFAALARRTAALRDAPARGSAGELDLAPARYLARRRARSGPAGAADHRRSHR